MRSTTNNRSRPTRKSADAWARSRLSGASSVSAISDASSPAVNKSRPQSPPSSRTGSRASLPAAKSSMEPRSPLSPKTIATETATDTTHILLNDYTKQEMAVPSLQGKTPDEENDNNHHLLPQHSLSTEATPDVDTMLDVQSFIDNIVQNNSHNQEGSTVPESSHGTASHHTYNLHLVQSRDHDDHDDEEASLVVDSAVIESIGRYIDTLQQQQQQQQQQSASITTAKDLTAIPSSSASWDETVVSPEMLALVQAWIEHLPAPPSSRGKTSVSATTTVTTTGSFDTVMQVDPETMAAVEACMELVTEKSKTTTVDDRKRNDKSAKYHDKSMLPWQKQKLNSIGSPTSTSTFGLRQTSIIVGAATITEQQQRAAEGSSINTTTVASEGTETGESKHDDSTEEDDTNDGELQNRTDSNLSEYATRSGFIEETLTDLLEASSTLSIASDAAITSPVASMRSSQPSVAHASAEDASTNIKKASVASSSMLVPDVERSVNSSEGGCKAPKSKKSTIKSKSSRNRLGGGSVDAPDEKPSAPSPRTAISVRVTSTMERLLKNHSSPDSSGNQKPIPSTHVTKDDELERDDSSACSIRGQDMAVPHVATFQSAGIFSQNSIPYENLASVPSYRSYGVSSSAESLNDDDSPPGARESTMENVHGDQEARSNSKLVPLPTAQTVTSEAATNSLGSPKEVSSVSSPNCAIQPHTKLIIKRTETVKTMDSDFTSKQEDPSLRSFSDRKIAAIHSGSHHDPRSSIEADSAIVRSASARSGNDASLKGTDSVDERIRGLIDAVEGWGGEGSFIDYTALNGASFDTKTLEALEVLVADAESCSHEDVFSMDDTATIPETLGEEIKNFLDALMFKKDGESIDLPTSFRVKKDPPASHEVPHKSEPREDPPVKSTPSSEHTRWNSSNDHPECNPDKQSISTGDSSHLDPLIHALSDELVKMRRAGRRTPLCRNVPPRPPSLTPDASSVSTDEVGYAHPASSYRSREKSTTSPPLDPSPSRKYIPPRPEDSGRFPKPVDEEKKEESFLFDTMDKRELVESDGASDFNSAKGRDLITAFESEDSTRSDSLGPRGVEVAKSFGSRLVEDTSSSPTKDDELVSDSMFGSKPFMRICEGVLEDPMSACEKMALAQLIRAAHVGVKQGNISDFSNKDFEGLPPDVVNSFIDAVTLSQKYSSELVAIPSYELLTMKAEKSRDRKSREAKELLLFLEQVAVVFRSDVRDPIPVDFIEGPTDSDANAIEYDINPGFVREEYVAVDPDGETPWWEATAKLAVASMDMLNGGENTDSEPEDTPSEDETNTATYTDSSKTSSSQVTDKKQQGGVEEDIDAFWKSQHDLRERRMQYRGSTRKDRAVEPPDINIASYSHSFQSQNTGNSGSVSKNTVESIETLDERWLLKRSMALHGQWSQPQHWLASKKQTVLDVGTPEPIDGVEATKGIYDLSLRWREQRDSIFSSGWNMSYERRCAKHSGYQGIDIYSLWDSSKANGNKPHRLDTLPWEKREVKQFFLFEQSVVNRNWFGKFKRYSSVTIEMPVCRPRSMEMPVKAPEWTEDWYVTPHLMALGTNLSESADGEAAEYYRKYVQSEEDSEEEEDWDDSPECGTLKNVKLKPGERISRVTPDLTSSLRRSRWRKKFFPKGSFPY